jgi:hypothetical protein
MPDVRRLTACGCFRGLRNEKYFTKDESRRPCQQARSRAGNHVVAWLYLRR